MSTSVVVQRVREGDFLPGLDNGYVFTEPEEAPEFGDYVRVLFHTAEGHEAYLIAPTDMPVTVDRKRR